MKVTKIEDLKITIQTKRKFSESFENSNYPYLIPRTIGQIYFDKRQKLLPLEFANQNFIDDINYLERSTSDFIRRAKILIESRCFSKSSPINFLPGLSLGKKEYLYLFDENNMGQLKSKDKAFGKLNYEKIKNKNGKLTKITHKFKEDFPFGIEKIPFQETKEIILHDCFCKHITSRTFEIKSIIFHYYFECEYMEIYLNLNQIKVVTNIDL